MKRRKIQTTTGYHGVEKEGPSASNRELGGPPNRNEEPRPSDERETCGSSRDGSAILLHPSIRFRWAIVFVGAALLGTFGYFASQLKPSEKGIGDIWPDDHVVARVNEFKSGPFLKGSARYMRVEIVFGLADNATTSIQPHERSGIDRSGTSTLDPTIKGKVVWNPEGFQLADPRAQSAFLSLCRAFYTSDARSWIHDVDCVLQDLIEYRAYFGFSPEDFPSSQHLHFGAA